MAQLRLAEYQTASSIPLTIEQRDLLAGLGAIDIRPTAHVDGAYELTAGSQVGAIHLPDLDIVIRPKVGLDRLLFMLSYAMGLGRWRAQDFRLGEEDDLAEAVIPGFVHQVETATRRGLLQGYRSDEDSLPTVRGRIRIADQVSRRFGVAYPIEVRFDEFTEDIELNRILRAAVVRLLRLRKRSGRHTGALRHLDDRLSAVSLVAYDGRRLPSVRWDRLNARYRPAVELALLILRSTSFELRHGDVAASAFLVDMNDLFEDFVVVALRDALGVSHRVLVQGKRGRFPRLLSLDEMGKVKLEPDLSWWEGGVCRFVGDVKYKRLSPAGFQHADLYQLTAYAIATSLPGGLLIYAAGEESPGSHVVVHLGKRLDVMTLDLTGGPDDILAETRRLARVVRRAAARGLTTHAIGPRVVVPRHGILSVR
jgi:5-methylcytosine-specific restriction enzyme subunit McrC